MGNCVQKISDKVTLIASGNSWVEDKALQQLQKTATLAGMHAVAGMPDLHPGRGYPVGASFYSHHRLYPALVGNDIGCGMALYQTSTRLAKLNLDKLERRLDAVEGPLDSRWHPEILRLKEQLQIGQPQFDQSLGTIGGGNHFVELQKVEQVFDEPRWSVTGADKKRLLLLVHSGSRGLGQQILSEHVREFSHSGLAAGSEAGLNYLRMHDEALRWAQLNRTLIAKRFLQALRSEGTALLDSPHNLISQHNIDGHNGWLHRKGAAPSTDELLVIPGSRGDYSYLVEPIPSGDSLYSVAHGAGRKWARGDCRHRLSQRYNQAALQRTALGSRVLCSNKELLYDEAPEAYKPCASVISDLEGAGLIHLIARLQPVLTYKTQGGC